MTTDNAPRIFQGDGYTIVELTGEEFMRYLDTGEIPGAEPEIDPAVAEAVEEVQAILMLTALTLVAAPHLLGKLGELRPELRARLAFTLRTSADALTL